MVKDGNLVAPEIGDLVRFSSGFESFMRHFESKNPGLVLSVHIGGGWPSDRASIQILWSDQSITTEHEGYVQVVRRNGGWHA
jgi:hypothetical protein